MFKNIGKKLMLVAKILCWVGIISSLILGLVLIFSGNNNNLVYTDSYSGMIVSRPVNSVATGIAVIIVGCLASWIGSFAIYGFGQLIEDNAAIRKMMEDKQ